MTRKVLVVAAVTAASASSVGFGFGAALNAQPARQRRASQWIAAGS